MLLLSEGSKAQGQVVEGGDDDDEVGLGAGLTWALVGESSGVDCVLEPRRSTRNVREIHEEDFVLDSEDTKEEEDERYDFGSDGGESIGGIWKRRIIYLVDYFIFQLLSLLHSICTM